MTNKKLQLGMNPSTASARLTKDLLFKFVVEAGHKCHRCGGELTRETFSMDHKKDWLHSDDPVGLYFDLENIAFSHFVCNTEASTRKKRVYTTPEERRKAQTETKKRWYGKQDKEKMVAKRRRQYEKHGQ